MILLPFVCVCHQAEGHPIPGSCFVDSAALCLKVWLGASGGEGASFQIPHIPCNECPSYRLSLQTGNDMCEPLYQGTFN